MFQLLNFYQLQLSSNTAKHSKALLKEQHSINIIRVYNAICSCLHKGLIRCILNLVTLLCYTGGNLIISTYSCYQEDDTEINRHVFSSMWVFFLKILRKEALRRIEGVKFYRKVQE